MKVIIQGLIIDLSLVYMISELKTKKEGGGSFTIYILNTESLIHINQTGLDFSEFYRYENSFEKDPIIIAKIQRSISNITNAYNELIAYWNTSEKPFPKISLEEVFPAPVLNTFYEND